MNKKRITLLINSLGGGGAEGVCVTLANSFVAKNIEVDLVVLSLQDSIRKNDLDHRVNLINLNTKRALKSFWKLKNYIINNNIGKILVFNFQLAIILVWIKSLFKLNLEIFARNINTLSEESKLSTGIWHKYITHFLARIFYRKVDLGICQSIGMADDLLQNYNFTTQKIKIINNPISQKIELYQKKINSFKRPHNKNNSYLLFIGRLEKQKGIHYLLKAFSKIDNKDIFLKILGKGSLELELKNLAKDLDIESRVFFEGYKTDVIPFILDAKAVVLTSIYEGFPNVLVESIALGTPVVAFNCKSGPSEIIKTGVNGYLVNYLDTFDLTQKLNKVISQEFNLKNIIQTADKFQIETIVSEYQAALFY